LPNALIDGKAVEDIRLGTYWNRVGAESFQPLDLLVGKT
jgi:hypothetical protein